MEVFERSASVNVGRVYSGLIANVRNIVLSKIVKSQTGPTHGSSMISSAVSNHGLQTATAIVPQTEQSGDLASTS